MDRPQERVVTSGRRVERFTVWRRVAHAGERNGTYLLFIDGVEARCGRYRDGLAVGLWTSRWGSGEVSGRSLFDDGNAVQEISEPPWLGNPAAAPRLADTRILVFGAAKSVRPGEELRSQTPPPGFPAPFGRGAGSKRRAVWRASGARDGTRPAEPNADSEAEVVAVEAASPGGEAAGAARGDPQVGTVRLGTVRPGTVRPSTARPAAAPSEGSENR